MIIIIIHFGRAECSQYNKIINEFETSNERRSNKYHRSTVVYTYVYFVGVSSTNTKHFEILSKRVPPRKIIRLLLLLANVNHIEHSGFLLSSSSLRTPVAHRATVEYKIYLYNFPLDKSRRRKTIE